MKTQLAGSASNRRGPFTAVVGDAVVVLSFLQVNVVLLLFAGGLLVMVVENLRGAWSRRAGVAAFAGPVLLGTSPASAAVAATAAATPVSLWSLTAFFLKIGSIVFGSGYVLLVFLRTDLVQRWGWLTDQQLIDAIAVGQFTPGPVFSAAVPRSAPRNPSLVPAPATTCRPPGRRPPG